MPKDGEVRKKKRGRSGTSYQIYRDPPGEWRTTTGDDYRKAKNTWLEQQGGSSSYNQLGAPGTPTTSLRYPEKAAMEAGSDYVLFDFYKYQPPFKGINKGNTKSNSTSLATYNQSATDEALYKKNQTHKSVVLYMPEDISTGYKANWSGKSFSNIGASAMTMFGSDDIGQLTQGALTTFGDAFDQLLPNVGAKTVQGIVSKVTGEQLSQNDIYGGTQGVILNPNVELLFGGHDLRNFQLRFKMVPRNSTEASNIKQIINQFRKAMLPSFGDDTTLKGFGGAVQLGGRNIQQNFIQVPNFCKVSFMRGGGLNPDVPQYKMCAITQVDINYTPDGTYATYEDGSMVAIELSVAFQESKLIFASEVEKY